MKIVFLIQIIVVGFSFSTAFRDDDNFNDYGSRGFSKYLDGEEESSSKWKVRAVRNDDEDEDIFTDYCRKGLCEQLGGDGAHSGCKNGTRHNGEFQYPPCSKNATIVPLTDKDKELILYFHNIQRNYVACGGLYKDHRLGPSCRHGIVTWDKELEKTAWLHSSYCTFEHDKCRSTLKYPFSGQNLGIVPFGTGHGKPATYINLFTYLWYLEYYYTKMDMIDKYYHQKEFMVGHFLTSLNERNNRVGCTLVTFFCPIKKMNMIMLSCNYPTTNIRGNTNYNSCKNQASKCKSGTDPKYKFLCTPKEKYDVSGFLKYTPYDGDGTEVFECGRQAELFHYEAEGSDTVKRMHLAMYSKFPMATERPKGQDTTTKKPEKTTTKKPTDEPQEGNPDAGGNPDYSESEYDPIDSPAQTIAGLKIKYMIILLFSMARWHQYFLK